MFVQKLKGARRRCPRNTIEPEGARLYAARKQRVPSGTRRNPVRLGTAIAIMGLYQSVDFDLLVLPDAAIDSDEAASQGTNSNQRESTVK